MNKKLQKAKRTAKIIGAVIAVVGIALVITGFALLKNLGVASLVMILVGFLMTFADIGIVSFLMNMAYINYGKDKTSVRLRRFLRGEDEDDEDADR